jgi:SAM-dependent methyltransferase
MGETDCAFWEEAWEKSGEAKRYLTLPHGFERAFDQFLPQASDGRRIDFLEIGCFPGRFLNYLARKFGYRVFGVDFVPQAAAIPGWLAELGVEAQVAVEDFFRFQPGRRYDVVASFGFVEHFANWQEVLNKHLELLNPGGILIIEFPNFRYGQYWLRKLLNPALLEGHILQVMKPGLWANALRQEGLEILYAGYYQTFRFWGRPAGRGLIKTARKVVMELVRFAQRVVNLLGPNFPNRFFSPYVFIVARRPASHPDQGKALDRESTSHGRGR